MIETTLKQVIESYGALDRFATVSKLPWLAYNRAGRTWLVVKGEIEAYNKKIQALIDEHCLDLVEGETERKFKTPENGKAFNAERDSMLAMKSEAVSDLKKIEWSLIEEKKDVLGAGGVTPADLWLLGQWLIDGLPTE
jgi:hypothetical protein